MLLSIFQNERYNRKMIDGGYNSIGQAYLFPLGNPIYFFPAITFDM